MKKIFTILFFLQIYICGQVNISVGNPPSDITFSAFTGTGFSPSPSAGQLDSDEWKVNGLSDGTMSFGDTKTAGDFSRGTSNGGVSIGGIYAFNIGSDNYALGIQPIGDDMTPGKITLRLVNNGTQNITDFVVSYKIYSRNDQARSNSFNFAYSEDDLNYVQVSSADFVSPATQDASPSWQFVNRTINITGLDAAQSEFIYLQWQLDDVSGSDNRDEFALDEISFSSVFPVELTTFAASVFDKFVKLEWETATEVNNYGFEIERASSLTSSIQDWLKIGFVNGSGNSNSPKEYSFTDRSVTNGKFIYRLKQIDTDGKYEFSKEVEVDLGLPKSYTLGQNYPNPFNPATKITYTLPVESNVQLAIFTVEGVLVKSLLNERQHPGDYSIDFNASELASGTYIYKLIANDFIQIKKMLLIK